MECLSGETTATVSIAFTGLSTSYFNVSNLSCINVPEGFNATIMEQTSVINVRAPGDVLSQVSANNIRVVADLTDVTATPGTTTTVRVPAAVYVDGFDAAGAVGDYTLFVRLEPAGLETEPPPPPQNESEAAAFEATDATIEQEPTSEPVVPAGTEGEP